MKKFLSLVLALAMTMSLVTVSAGAKDFTDADDIQYVEAVEVMSEIGIVDGDTAGNFNATAGLTRGAAAKIICNLILGPTTAAELNADTDPYVDVDKNSTFAGYIAYCQKANIISGYADGTFKPAAPLTGYAFMKMLLGALGYDGAVEGYTGANWSINVAKQAIGIGLNDGLLTDFNGSAYVTREEAMLYAFNTLQATMVDYDTTITIGDVTVAGSKASDVENKARVETIKDDNLMQFAEKYFSKLTVEPAVDVFGRPANTWATGKTTIGTYVDYTELVEEYTTKMSGKDLFNVLGADIVDDDDYSITIYMDGVKQPASVVNEIVKNNKSDFSLSGKGALTQVFVDKDNQEVVITVINTYLAQATADYNAKTEKATFAIFGVKKSGDEIIKNVTAAENKITGIVVENEDINVESIKEDQFVLVTVAEGDIQTIAIPEVVEDVTITSFTKGEKIIAGGVTYNYAVTVDYNYEVLDAYSDNNMKEKTYNVYLDPYGNLIGLEYVTSDDNYVFITGVDKNNSNLSNKTWTANAIFMDGTTQVIDVKNNGAISSDGTTINTWYTYTLSKDVYTLSTIKEGWATGYKIAQAKVDDGSEITIDYKHPSLKLESSPNMAYVYGNSDTVYMTAKLDKVYNGTSNDTVISGVSSVTTGLKNTSIVTYKDAADKVTGADNELAYSAYVLHKSNGYIIAAVVVGQDAAVSENLVYINSDNVNLESYSASADEWTWTREVILNGQATELKEVGDTLTKLGNDPTNGKLTQYAWYVVSTDASGNVTGMDKVISNKTNIEYVNSFAGGAIQTAINTGKDTVLYEQDFIDRAESLLPELVGQTLYLNKNNQNGFFVAEDVNVVLIQTNDGKTTTTYDTGASAIKSAIDNLNAASDNKYDYELTAVIKNGAATTVIIRDTTNGTAGAGSREDTTAGVITGTSTPVGVSDKNGLLAQVDGAYTFPASASFTYKTEAGTNWTAPAGKLDKYIFFKFETTKDNQSVMLTIKNAAGVAQADGCGGYTFPTAGAHTLFTCYAPTTCGTTSLPNWTPGTYTWDVSSSGVVLASGSFTIA